MISNISIKKVSIKDVLQLQTIGKKTFFETFSSENTEENMIKYLEEGFAIQKLMVEIENENSEFYFSMLENEVIGYLKLNFGPSQTELMNEETLEIERIYVLNEFHGRNIGQLLYDKAIDIARKKRVNYVWLGVWERNLRAIGFYKKNGFIEFDKHIFRLGDDEQTDIMMRLELQYS